MIECVVFDLDNTLYDYDYCNELAIESLAGFACKRFDIARNCFDAAFNRARTRVKEQLGEVGASHNRMLYMQTFLEEIGHNPVQGALELYDVYWEKMLEKMRLFEYVTPLMVELQKRRVKIGVLTDLTTHIQHRKIIKLGIDGYVDVLVTSEEAGQEKPSIKIFDLMIKKTGLRPEDMLMVGDSQVKDIEGAVSAGMKGYLFDKNTDRNVCADILELLNDGMD